MIICMRSQFLYVVIAILIFKLSACVDRNTETDSIDSGDAMKEFRNNIESNRILTIQILDSTADNNLENKIIANIHSKQDVNLANDKEVIPTLSKPRQAIFYIYLVEGEVNNGGFDQFYLNHFINSDGSYMFDKTSEAFQLIGAKKFAEIVNQANAIYKTDQKNFIDKRGLFDKLDQAFYDTYKVEDLDDLKIKFIRANLNAFVDK
jgi:hypothetical protein